MLLWAAAGPKAEAMSSLGLERAQQKLSRSVHRLGTGPVEGFEEKRDRESETQSSNCAVKITTHSSRDISAEVLIPSVSGDCKDSPKINYFFPKSEINGVIIPSVWSGDFDMV